MFFPIFVHSAFEIAAIFDGCLVAVDNATIRVPIRCDSKRAVSMNRISGKFEVPDQATAYIPQ